nr:unnamed protein product [Spirometra erinaceieuropaei]
MRPVHPSCKRRCAILEFSLNIPLSLFVCVPRSFPDKQSSNRSSNPTLSDIPVSSRTMDKVKIAKVTLENYYANLAAQFQDRQNRYTLLECLMEAEGLTEDQKNQKRCQHALKESEFLRLKRARLTVDDFTPLKIIGKGAFGEVIASTSEEIKKLELQNWSVYQKAY